MSILKDAIIHEGFLELANYERLTDRAAQNNSTDPRIKTDIDKSRRKIEDLLARLDVIVNQEKEEARIKAQKEGRAA